MSATLASMWTKVPLPSCHPGLTCPPVRSHRRPRPRGQALEQGGAMVGPSAMSPFAKRRSQVQSDHDGGGASVELPAELPRSKWRRRECRHHHRVSGKATSALLQTLRVPQCGGGDSCDCPDGWVRLEVSPTPGETLVDCVLVGGPQELVTKEVRRKIQNCLKVLL